MSNELLIAILAFLGASIALLIENWFANRREEKQNNKQVYKEFYAPIVRKIFRYFDVYANTTDENIVGNRQNILKEIIDDIDKNIIYAGPQTFLAHYKQTDRNFRIQTSRHQDFDYDVEDLQLLLAVLNDFKILNKTSWLDKLFGRYSILSDELIQELSRYRVLYLVWITLFRSGYRDIWGDLSTIPMKYIPNMPRENFTDRTYNRIENFLKKPSFNRTNFQEVTKFIIKEMVSDKNYAKSYIDDIVSQIQKEEDKLL